MIVERERFQCTVTAYVNETPTVTYDTTTFQDAQRWAKVVIGYKD